MNEEYFVLQNRKFRGRIKRKDTASFYFSTKIRVRHTHPTEYTNYSLTAF
jgi:hypothetical protein